MPLAVKTYVLPSFRDFTGVFAQVGDTYEVRMLDLGRSDGGLIEVLGELGVGERYVAANLFFGTGIPAAILLFNKGKTHGDVLFIDASRDYADAKNQNVLTDAHLNKIVATYDAFQPVDKYAYRATAQEIADND